MQFALCYMCLIKMFLGDAWILDVASLNWTQLTHFPTNKPRLWHTACVTHNQEVLVFGGCGNNILANEEDSQVVCIYYLAC